MLTLKVITLDRDGHSRTELFSGEVISHEEFETNDYTLDNGNQELITIGNLGGVAQSEQKYTYSIVKLHSDSWTLKAGIIIFPHADCFIMDNGKTVDSFSCVYK